MDSVIQSSSMEHTLVWPILLYHFKLFVCKMMKGCDCGVQLARQRHMHLWFSTFCCFVIKMTKGCGVQLARHITCTFPTHFVIKMMKFDERLWSSARTPTSRAHSEHTLSSTVIDASLWSFFLTNWGASTSSEIGEICTAIYQTFKPNSDSGR